LISQLSHTGTTISPQQVCESRIAADCVPDRLVFIEGVSTDFLVVSTVRFRLLFVFVVLGHDRRRAIHFNVTAHPTAEWTATDR
jgi:hypothetical protein